MINCNRLLPSRFLHLLKSRMTGERHYNDIYAHLNSISVLKLNLNEALKGHLQVPIIITSKKKKSEIHRSLRRWSLTSDDELKLVIFNVNWTLPTLQTIIPLNKSIGKNGKQQKIKMLECPNSLHKNLELH